MREFSYTVSEKSFSVTPSHKLSFIGDNKIREEIHDIFSSPQLSVFKEFKNFRNDKLIFLADLDSLEFKLVDFSDMQKFILNNPLKSGYFYNIFSHENVDVISPIEDFSRCELTNALCHHSSMVVLTDDNGGIHKVNDLVRVEDLHCETCGNFIFGTNENFIVADDGTVFCCKDCAEKAGYVQCHDCENWTKDYSFIAYHNDYVCKTCIDSDYTTCDSCGSFIPLNSRKRISFEGKSYCCEDCAITEGLTRCSNCGDWTDNPFYASDVDEYFCESCYDETFTACAQCGETIRIEDAIEIHNRYYCCAECANDAGYIVCSKCGEEVDRTEDDSDGENEIIYLINGNEVCSKCAGRAVYEGRRLIDGYHSHKNDYDFKSTDEDEPGKKLFEGPEHEIAFLEATNFNDAMKELKELSETSGHLFFLTSDTTTGRYGVENVFQPCTLSYYHKNSEYFKKYFSIIRKHGLALHNHCGMHIHLSRKGISPTHEIKLEMFFMLYYKLIERISDRIPNEYCMRVEQGRDLKDHESFKSTSYSCRDRYRALNWNNEKTVEFRCFKSPATYEKFMVNIEFAHAVYQFTKIVSFDELEEASESSFINFAFDNKEKYSFLSDYLNLIKN